MTSASRLYVAVAAALAVQSIAGLLWAGAAANRLTQLEISLRRMPALEVRAARLEEQTKHQSDALVRIEHKLDRALEEQRP